MQDVGIAVLVAAIPVLEYGSRQGAALPPAGLDDLVTNAE